MLVLADPPRHGGQIRDGGRDRPHVEPMPSTAQLQGNKSKTTEVNKRGRRFFFTTSEHKPRNKHNETPRDPAKLHLALGVPDGCPLDGHDLPLATHARQDHAGRRPHLASRVNQPSSPKTRTSINSPGLGYRCSYRHPEPRKLRVPAFRGWRFVVLFNLGRGRELVGLGHALWHAAAMDLWKTNGDLPSIPEGEANPTNAPGGGSSPPHQHLWWAQQEDVGGNRGKGPRGRTGSCHT